MKSIKKKGFALITVLAVLVMIALGTATILQSVGSQMNMKSNNLQEVKSQYLAEAGMQYALWKCKTSGCASMPASVTIDGTTVSITAAETPVGSKVYRIITTINYDNV